MSIPGLRPCRIRQRSLIVALGGAFASAVLTWRYGLPLVPTEAGSGDRIALTVGVATAVVGVLLAVLMPIPMPLPHPPNADRSFRDRYDVAAKQIAAHGAPAEQQAGVAALASLATVWLAGRQDCIDVLCGYLRLPYDPTRASPGDRQVRLFIVEAIKLHLDGSSEVGWQDCRFDFSGAVFDGGALDEARFMNGSVSFRDCTFTNAGLSMRKAVFSSCRVDCSQVRIDDGSSLDFDGAIFSMATTTFSGIEMSSAGLLSFQKTRWWGGSHCFDGIELRGGRILFDEAEFMPIRPASGTGQRAQFSFIACKLGLGELSFRAARFDYKIEVSSRRKPGQRSASHESLPPWPWTLTFHKTQFDGATVDFTNAQFVNGYVDLSAVVVTAGSLLFRGAAFREGCVGFVLSKISDIVLDFSYAHFMRESEFFARSSLDQAEDVVNSVGENLRTLNYPTPSLNFTDTALRNVRLEFEFVNCFAEGSGIVDFKGAYFDGADLCFVHAAVHDLIIVLWKTRYLSAGGLLRLHEFAQPVILTDNYQLTHNELVIVEADRNREGHEGSVRRVTDLREVTPYAFGISSLD